MESEPAASASASSFDMRGAPPTVSVKTEEEDGWVQVEKKIRNTKREEREVILIKRTDHAAAGEDAQMKKMKTSGRRLAR